MEEHELNVVVLSPPRLWTGHGIELPFTAEGETLASLMASFSEGLYELVHDHLEELGHVEKLRSFRWSPDRQIQLMCGDLAPLATCRLDVAPLPYRLARFYLRTTLAPLNPDSLC